MSGHSQTGWLVFVSGLILAAIGLIWMFAPSIPYLGRLPGDIRVERDNFRFYFPVVTCLLISILISVVVWLVRLFRT